MIYEVLRATGRKGETRAFVAGRWRSWRRNKNLDTFIIKYRQTRPSEYQGYESLFKGNPYEMADYLFGKQNDYTGVKMEKPAPRPPEAELLRTAFRAMDSESRPALEAVTPSGWPVWAQVAIAALAAGSAGALYYWHFIGW